jgi:anti-sigma regulatory factor (Ser/Thr protein kinase)
LTVNTLIQLPGTGLQSVGLDAKPEAVGAARSYVTTVLRAWAVPTDIIDIAVLLTSELATNAVMHGSTVGGAFTVEVRSHGCCIGIEVSDSSANVPVVHIPASETQHGRGLLLVVELADSWGYYFDSGGLKHVWFHLRVDDPTVPPADTAVVPAA